MSDWRNEWREANRANWDERVPLYVSGEFYDVAGFKAGQERLRPFELSEVGTVAGKDLVHLQCHFGIDALSWARRGARVVGLDFSAPAIEEARRLAAELVGQPARLLYRRSREVQPHHPCAATGPAQGVDPEVTLEVHQVLAGYAPDLRELEGA